MKPDLETIEWMLPLRNVLLAVANAAHQMERADRERFLTLLAGQMDLAVNPWRDNPLSGWQQEVAMAEHANVVDRARNGPKAHEQNPER